MEKIDTPFTPDPVDGEQEAPVDTVLAWNGVRPPALARLVTQKIVYGSDDRRDEYQVTDSAVIAAGDSTVAMVPVASLMSQPDGSFSLPKDDLATDYESQVGRPLCEDEPYRDQPDAALCSGFLVAPDTVATAGHCILSDAECAAYAFVFGHVMADAATSVVTLAASDVYFCSEILARNDGDADWALIRLDRPVVDHVPLAVRQTGKIADNENLLVIGHPLGLPRKYAAGDDTRVRDNSDSILFWANLDTYGGNYSSTVFNARTLEVEGILGVGNFDFEEDGDCDRSAVCPDSGCTGGDVSWEVVVRDHDVGRSAPDV